MQGINRAWVQVAPALLAAVLLVAGLAACTIDVKDSDKKGAKKVDIETPAGSLHVRTSADIADTGLSAYPGARQVAKDDHDSKGANISMEAPSGEGLHLVVLHYESDDPPGKITTFYRDQLKKYGAVTECKGDLNYSGSPSQKHSECRPNDSGKIALAAGSGDDNQRIVSVKPKGTGSEFDVVYIRTHPEKGTI